MLAWAPFLLLLAAPPAPEAGQVRLPLRDYVSLVEAVEARDAERRRAGERVEPSVAEIVSQRVSVSLGEEVAEVTTSFEVDVRGRVERTIPLPLSGVAERVLVEPAGEAALHWKARGAEPGSPGGPELVAPRPGRYRVQVNGRLEIERDGGIERLRLAPMTAPVAELLLSMPADRVWRSPRAVVAEDSTEAGRRRLRLALPRGEAAVVEVRRETRPQEPARAIASAVVVTVVSLGRDLTRRHDIVLYEVQRGEIGTMVLGLPQGVEPEDVVTDEGPALQWLDGRTVRVERTKKLTGSGYLAVISQPGTREAISLEPLVPETKVRARYLAYASGIAASFAPDPAESWARADVTDLPEAVRQVAGALGIVAAWRQRPEAASGSLRIAALPSPKALDAVITRRDTTTLLTVEDTLLHRDRFTVEGEQASLEVELPPNGVVWSAQVGEVPVRPVDKGGSVLVPLGMAASGPRSVEVVVVQERAIAAGRSTLELALPSVAVPVLKHEWRLLLPERNRYRYAGGSLRPQRLRALQNLLGVEAGVVGGIVSSLPAAPPAPGAANFALGGGGTAELRGNVLDATGSALPGAEVQLSDRSRGRVLKVTTDASGEFRFAGLAGGTYAVRAELAGFRTAEHRAVSLAAGQTRAISLILEIGAIAESLAVDSSELTYQAARAERRLAIQEQNVARFADELIQLKQGLVGGVKPLPVKIPEAGKVLNLAGALPPQRVVLALEVKAPKN